MDGPEPRGYGPHLGQRRRWHPDGQRRRVVVVVETRSEDDPVSWRDVVAVHVDDRDDARPDDDLAWWATQEIGDLLASG